MVAGGTGLYARVSVRVRMCACVRMVGVMATRKTTTYTARECVRLINGALRAERLAEEELALARERVAKELIRASREGMGAKALVDAGLAMSEATARNRLKRAKDRMA